MSDKLIPFDDRDGFIWFNGKIVDWRDAKIHVLNHGLHYGSCVFEGIRAYNGKPFKLTEHNQRLLDSAKILGFEVPYTVEELDKACMETLEKQGLKSAYLRPLAWRGSEQMAIRTNRSTIHTAIAIWDMPAYFGDEAKEKGIKMCFAKYKRPSPETAPTAAKAAGLYMICTISKNEADDKGYGDALMLDYRGLVAEATGANIFLLIDGKLHTPTPDCFLDGITRRTVIDLAKKRGIEVVERQIKPEELKDATEVFLTGTAAEVTPVGSIEGEQKYEFIVGETTKNLMQDYSELVNS